MKPKSRLSRRLSLATAIALGAIPAANAASTYQWTGTTDGNLSGTTTDYSPNGTPGSADTIEFNAASYTNAPTANAAMGIGELWFAAGDTAGVTFGSGTGLLTLSGVSGEGIQIDSGSGAVNTGSAKFALAGNQSWTNNSANTLTVGGTITNTANTTPYTLTLNGTGNTALSGIISNGGTTGTLALTKSGTGTLTLSGANTYSGATTISAGTLQVGNSAAFGSGAVTVSNGSVLQAGASGYTLANAFTFGTGGGVIDTQSYNMTMSGSWGASANSITKIGSGKLTYSNAASNTTAIPIYLKQGTLSITGTGQNNEFGTGTVTLGDATSQQNATLSFDMGSTASQRAFGSNPLTVANAGAATLTLAFSGGTNSGWQDSFGGAISLSHDLVVQGNATNGGGTNNGYGGRFQNWVLTGNISGTGDLHLQNTVNSQNASLWLGKLSATVTTETMTINNVGKIYNDSSVASPAATEFNTISAAIGTNVTGVVQNGTVPLALGGNNTFSTGVQLLNGEVDVELQNAALGTGTFQIGNSTGTTAVTVDALDARSITNALNIYQDFTFQGTANLTQGTGAITLSTNGTTGTHTVTVTANTLALGGVIGDGGSAYGITKAGAGTLALSGANTYSGATTISAGILQANVAQNGTTSGPLGKSGNIVFGGGTLQFTSASAAWDPSARIAAGTTSGNVSIDTNGQTITFGSALTASQTGGLTLNDSNATPGTLILSAANAYTGGTVLDGGTLQLGASGTLGNTTNALTFGATAASTGVSTLDLTNAGATVGSLTVQTNSASNNTLKIGSGKTLTVNGAVTIGQGSATATTNLLTSGTGSFTMNSSGSNFTVLPTNSNSQTVSANFGTLSNFTVTAANFGVGGTGGASTSGTATLTLSGGTNTLKATTLGVAWGGYNITTAASTLSLAGTTTIDANTIIVGQGYPSGAGTIQFGSSGSVKIRNNAGTGAANLSIGYRDYGSTGGTETGTVDLSGGTADALIGTLTMAQNYGHTTRSGTSTGTLTFGSAGDITSTMDVTTITLDTDPTGTFVGTSNSTINVQGGTFRFGTMTVGASRTNFTANATLNLKGGTLASTGGTAVSTPAGVAIGLGSTSGAVMTFGQASGGTGAITLNGGITLANNTTVTTAVNTNFAGAIGTASYTLAKSGSATLTLSGSAANLNTGLVTVSAGELDLNKTAGVNAIGGNLTVSGGTAKLLAANQLADSATVTVSGGILDTGTALTDTVSAFNMSSGSLNGTGTITATTYGLTGGTVNAKLGAGTINVSTGTVTLGSAGRLTGTPTLNVSSGQLTLAGAESVGAYTQTGGTLGGSGNTLTATSYALQGGTVTANLGTGNVTVTSGTTTLNGTEAGTTVNINSGTLALGASDRLANGATVTVAGGILDTTASNYTDTVGTFNMSGGSLNGGGTITATTYGLTGGTVNAQLGAGTINVSTGTVALGSAGRLTGTPTLNVSSGQLTLAGTESVGAYTQTGGTLAGTGNTLTSGTAFDMQAGTVSANLGGTGIALNKTTGGTVTLNNANTYTGVTTISGGTLALGSGGSISNSSSIIVGNAGSSGAKLDATLTSGLTIGSSQKLSGIGTVDVGSGTLTINGTHAPGNSPGVQTVTGNLNYGANSIFEWDLASSAHGSRGTDYDGVNVSGTLGGAGGATFKVILGSGSFSDTFWNVQHTWTDIFSATNASTKDLSTIFGTVKWYQGATDMTTSTGTEGYFTLNGSANTLTWTAVPEPTGALVGLLIGAGLLRRRRAS